MGTGDSIEPPLPPAPDPNDDNEEKLPPAPPISEDDAPLPPAPPIEDDEDVQAPQAPQAPIPEPELEKEVSAEDKVDTPPPAPPIEDNDGPGPEVFGGLASKDTFEANKKETEQKAEIAEQKPAPVASETQDTVKEEPVKEKKFGDADGAVDPDALWPDEPPRLTEDHVDPLLSWCVSQGSSDVSLQSDRPVYNDIQGKLRPGTKKKLDGTDMAMFATKIYGADALARLASGNDLDISYEIKYGRNDRQRFRVNITAILSKGRDGIQITMRSLPTEPPTMEMLGIEEDLINNWAPRDGIVVVTGPTGSGKSTLLAAGNRMLIERPDGCGKMLTYEAPIEFTYDTVAGDNSLIAQTEVPRHLKSFEAGIRNALRRKPNIIMVGEARDTETISASIEAAQTGHAVYTTTHTTGVATTVRRMISAFPANEREERAYSLMETLRVICTQILVPKKGGGRVGIREWLVFDDDLREKLLDMDFDKWGVELMRIVPQLGRSMAKSAEIAFERGDIEARYYKLITKNAGR